MVTWLLPAIMMAFSPAPWALPASGGLVAYGITVEGTAVITVTADVCEMEFEVEGVAPTAAKAVDVLAARRKLFETAVRRVIGGRGEIIFKPTRIATLPGKEHTRYLALQTALLRYSGFPKDAQDFNRHVEKITLSVADAGVTPRDFAEPLVRFEISKPGGLEERLVDAAVENARRRAKVVCKPLKRTTGKVLSAHFSGGAYVDGAYVPFTTPPQPALTREIRSAVMYTVNPPIW